jgi:hypothetical protein
MSDPDISLGDSHFKIMAMEILHTVLCNFVVSEFLTAVVMKRSAFWDITPCSPLKSTHVSGEHVASIFRVRRISQARNQHEASRTLCELFSFSCGIEIVLYYFCLVLPQSPLSVGAK